MVRFGDDNLARRGRDGAKQRRARMFPRCQNMFLLPLEIPCGADGLIIADMSLVLKDYDLMVGDVFFNVASSSRNAACRAGSALART